ncbi:MAG TPA: DUF983 domain-containing protein [Hansschlegelia sp.]
MSVQPIAGEPAEERLVGRSMLRGLMCRCPGCGEGKMYSGYLKVAPVCSDCGEELHHQRADDAPPYVVIFIVGHVVVSALLAVEVAYHPPVWLHMALWVPLTIIMSLALLPPVKGALIGMQWALRMHGFGGESDETPSKDGGLSPTRSE